MEGQDNNKNQRKNPDTAKQAEESESNRESTGEGTKLCQSAGPRRGLVHSVSIVVEPAINLDEANRAGDAEDDDDDDDFHITPPVAIERRRTIAGPIVLLEDLYFDQPKKGKEYDDIVQSLFASARLRKEEFARLLEEHAQIVNEINKAETNLL